MSPVHFTKKDNRTFERLRLVTIKVPIFLWDADTEHMRKGFGFVADFSESGAGVFVPDQLTNDSIVLVAFEAESAASYRGRIVWCNRFALEQKFFGHKGLSYRAGIKFLFSSEAQRQHYLEYLQEIRKRAMVAKPGLAF